MDTNTLFQRLSKISFSRIKPAKAKLPILFTHIPKTAGTSFRHAAEESNQITHVLSDYGKDNPTNTPGLNKAIYHSREGPSIEHVIGGFDDFILVGHFPTARYMKFFYPHEL